MTDDRRATHVPDWTKSPDEVHRLTCRRVPRSRRTMPAPLEKGADMARFAAAVLLVLAHRRAGWGAGPVPRRNHGRLPGRRGARRHRPAGHRSPGRRFRGARGRRRPVARLVRSQQRRERGEPAVGRIREAGAAAFASNADGSQGPPQSIFAIVFHQLTTEPRARATRAAHALVDRLAPGDYCGIYVFDKELTELAAFTRDRDLLHRAIRDGVDDAAGLPHRCRTGGDPPRIRAHRRCRDPSAIRACG